MNAQRTPVILCILDGWGHTPDASHNAIAAARTPHWDELTAHYPHSLLDASELHVGLPEGQMGNSEVGHMNIGAGRVVMQDLPRIDQAIASGALATDAQLKHFIAALKTSGGSCHLMGLLSDGGVHAHIGHIIALCHILSQHGVPVWLHPFLDGRDTPPKSALTYLSQLQTAIATLPGVRIGTIAGRYYAMDRDKRWDRVQLAYDRLMGNASSTCDDVQAYVASAYAAGTTDEFVLPACLASYSGMKTGDGLLMANFRADRARQLLDALLNPAFNGFERGTPVAFAATLGMVRYSDTLAEWMPALFAPHSLSHLLGEVVSAAGRTQLRIAETEKYAHVTFFFNGGREQVFNGEERILVPSPNVPTYDLQPEMSAYQVTDALEDAIRARRFDFYVVNYANTDMVGHSGDFQAAIKAVEAVDTCLGRLQAAVADVGGSLLITADHGNAESMHDHETDQPHTAHTLNKVPAIVMNRRWRDAPWRLHDGQLADIAPTLLSLMGIDIPADMTGHSLLPADVLPC